MTQLACVTHRLIRTTPEAEIKPERFYKDELAPAIGLRPSTEQQRSTPEGLGTRVKYLGEYSQDLSECLAGTPGAPSWDPNNPRHIFLFEISNKSNELRNFTPYMDFPSKNVPLASGQGAGNCATLMEYLPVTGVDAVPGESKLLECGNPEGGGPESRMQAFVHTTPHERIYSLYPQQERRGIMIATQPANPDAVAGSVSRVDGNFMVYVHKTDTGQKPKVLTIPYSFSRNMASKRVAYDLITERSYDVETYQKVFNFLLVLPVASGEPYKKRVAGSEKLVSEREVRVD